MEQESTLSADHWREQLLLAPSVRVSETAQLTVANA